MYGNYTRCSRKRSPSSFCSSFYTCWPIFITFGTQYTEVIGNTAVIQLTISPAHCCYTTLENFKLHNNDVMTNIAVMHTEKYPFFHTIIVQQSSNITITFSFIHTGLTGGHKPGSVNLGVSRCSNSTVWCTHQCAGTLPCWKMSASQQWHKWMKHLLHQHSVQHHGSIRAGLG